jgi:dTMP kinase
MVNKVVAKNSQQGRFVVLEGPEGAGKTTQLKILAKYLDQLAVEHIVTRDPGGTALGKYIRRILLDADTAVDPLAELLLYEADRAQHVQEVIRPALNQGKLVLCDRYTGSTYAYQGYGRGIDLNLIKQLNLIATGGLEPELVILFDIASEEGLNRLHPSGHDRMEQEAIEFHHKVRSGYLEMAKARPEIWKIIDASQPLSTVQTELRKILSSGLSGRLDAVGNV